MSKPMKPAQTLSSYVFCVSDLTKIIGEALDTCTDEGRSVYWSSDECGYFFSLHFIEDGKITAQISDTAHPKVYEIMGYCIYHKIEIDGDWTNWITEKGEKE